MLRKSTASSRNTRSSTANATVLKPIYPNLVSKKPQSIAPAVPSSNSHSQQQQQHQQQQQFSHLDSTSSFLLPSSEFFVVDKDSLVLSESDIFQSNLARRGLGGATRASNTNDEDIIMSSSPINIKAKGRNVRVEEESLDLALDEKENDETLYGALLNAHISNNTNMNNNHNPLTAHPRTNSLMNKNTISGMKSSPVVRSTPVESNTHVSSSASASVVDKGLRHFSAKVSAKVEEKGVTTYNEVADELVREIGLEMGKCDHKNIRRRVYDALNVLMAIDIIRKEKKEIRWLGLPNEAADDLRALETERQQLQERISEKSKNLREILRRCISLKNLIDRNAELQKSSVSFNTGDKLPLPFILISAARDCHVHCEMLEDRTQYFFEFNTSFQINEDIELMRLMGLDTGRIERIKSFFPKELVAQVLLLCLGSNNSSSGSGSNTNQSNLSLISSFSDTNTRSIFAPIINNEDLNLGDLETFSATSSSISSNLSSSL